MSFHLNITNNLEGFSLTNQLLVSIHDIHQSDGTLATVTARVVGCSALPIAAIGDVFVHVTMTVGKTATGLVAYPWNGVVLIFGKDGWQIPSHYQLPSALIHLMQVIQAAANIIVLSLLCLFSPERAFEFTNSKKMVKKQLVEEKNPDLEKELKIAEDQKQALEKAFIDLNQQAQRSYLESDQKLKDLEIQKQQLESAIEQMIHESTKEKQRFSLEREESEHKLKNLESQQKQLNSVIEQLNQLVHGSHEEKQIFEQKMQQLQQDKQNLEEEIQTLRQQKQQLENEQMRLAKELAEQAKEKMQLLQKPEIPDNQTHSILPLPPPAPLFTPVARPTIFKLNVNHRIMVSKCKELTQLNELMDNINTILNSLEKEIDILTTHQELIEKMQMKNIAKDIKQLKYYLTHMKQIVENEIKTISEKPVQTNNKSNTDLKGVLAEAIQAKFAQARFEEEQDESEEETWV